MNERIKELFDEAANYAMKNTKFHIDHEREEWQKDVDNLLKEKFAELIVRECAMLVETLSPGYNDYRDQIENAFRRDCVDNIKQHFGFE